MESGSRKAKQLLSAALRAFEIVRWNGIVPRTSNQRLT